MKKKTKKDLEVLISKFTKDINMLQQNISSYNALFSMYTEFKGDSVKFQEYLKKQIEKQNGIKEKPNGIVL